MKGQGVDSKRLELTDVALSNKTRSESSGLSSRPDLALNGNGSSAPSPKGT